MDSIAEVFGINGLDEEWHKCVNAEIWNKHHVNTRYRYKCQKGPLNNHYGMKHSEETKKLISKKRRTRKVEPRTGKKHSEEAKAKMRAAKLGKKLNRTKPAWNKGVKGWHIRDGINLITQKNTLETLTISSGDQLGN